MLASQVSIASIYANGWKILKIIDKSRWVLLPIVWLNYQMKGKNVAWKMVKKTFAPFPGGPFSRLNALIIEDNILPFASADSLQNSKIDPCIFWFVKWYS